MHQVTLIPGDGVGPEIIKAACCLIDGALKKLGRSLIQWDIQEAGEKAFQRGIKTGVPEETIQSIRTNKVAFKGPLMTPVGHGSKSANVTLRKLFETFGNIRPVKQYPGVPSPYAHRPIDLVIVRENLEDLYTGMEYVLSSYTCHAFKTISLQGCERIVRLAFETARAGGYKKVHCATKANILKLTEGRLKEVFIEIAPEYPDIEAHHILVDNCAHQLVKRPEQFEVIVMTNMNGDILSDLASGLVGGLGFAPSANVGKDVAIFEAVHGTASKYADKDIINPTAAILTGAIMLRHLGENEAATLIEDAVAFTLNEGKARTRDIALEGHPVAGTIAYTEAVLANLGKKNSDFHIRPQQPIQVPQTTTLRSGGHLLPFGVDIFIKWNGRVEDLVNIIHAIYCKGPFLLESIASRGFQVYPDTGVQVEDMDVLQCRMLKPYSASDPEIAELVRTFPGRIVTIQKLIKEVQDETFIPLFSDIQGAG